MTAQRRFAFLRPRPFRAADLLPNPAQDEANAWLARTPDWPLRRLAVWGDPGSGKSHLLHAWAESIDGTVLDTPRQGFPDRPVAIDAIDAIADEAALFHLVNAAQEARQPLLLACTLPPGRLPTTLPDLASRLRATTAVRIGPSSDEFLTLLLVRLLADRQLGLDAGLQAWLLRCLPRNPAAIRDAVERLDEAGLDTGRRITRRFAAAVLGFDDNSAGDADPPSPPMAGLG